MSAFVVSAAQLASCLAGAAALGAARTAAANASVTARRIIGSFYTSTGRDVPSPLPRRVASVGRTPRGERNRFVGWVTLCVPTSGVIEAH